MHQVSPAMAKKLGGRRKTRKTKKGGYYSAVGAIAPGAMEWSRGSEMSGEAGGRGGNAQMGGRKKKRGGKKTRKVKAKRGGGSFAQAVSGFTGVGTARGLGGYQDVSMPTGKAAGGAFNDYSAKPGDFSSFQGIAK